MMCVFIVLKKTNNKNQADRLDRWMEWMSELMVGWMCTQTHKHPLQGNE